MKYEIVDGSHLSDKSGRDSDYPFLKMEVGQAFYLPKEEAPAVRSAITYQAKKNKTAWSLRQYSSEQHPNGYACKRIS